MHHLESIVIHWTRQIKDVVNNDDNALNTEILGPLEEIEVVISRIRRMRVTVLPEPPTAPGKSIIPDSRNDWAFPPLVLMQRPQVA